MRLIRLGEQPSGVTVDIRSALTAIGRGAVVVGGVALFGVSGPDGRPVDAVVLMPRGILVIGSVTLPGPALRLDAPLNEPWRADGWTVETNDGAVNPADNALELTGRVAARLRELHPAGAAARISTVIAVGPYVEYVEQPAGELTGSTRVLHPTATSMLSATVSMPRQDEPLTTTGVRTLLTALGPDSKQPGDDELLAEGFAPAPLSSEPDPAAQYLGAAESTVATGPPSAETTSTPAPESTTPAQHGKSRFPRWLVAATLTLLGCLLIVGAVTAMVGNGESDQPSSAGESSTPRHPSTEIAGISFTPHASGATDTCARHAYGDLRARLEDEDCLRLHRGSFIARVNGSRVATTVAVLSFPDRATAEDFRKLARRPGTGGIDDMATQRDQWPGKRPRFSGAAYTTNIHKATVHLVRAGRVAESSRADDATLDRAAEATLQLPLPE